MHRTTLVLRSLRWSLLLALLCHAGATSAPAQGINQPPNFAFQQVQPDPKVAQLPEAKAPAEAAEPAVLILPVGESRQVKMSTGAPISRFISDNPKVCRAQSLATQPAIVIVTGLSPGSTRVTLTDNKNNTEQLEIRVIPDDESQRLRQRQELLGHIRKAVPTATVDVIASPRTLVLTGNVPQPENVQVILELARSVFGDAANVVNAMRIGGVQQVAIEVIVARVNRGEARKVGFSFVNLADNHFLASTIGGGATFAATNASSPVSAAASLSSAPNIIFGVFDNKHGIFTFLQALRTEGLAKLMAEPRVVTLSGRPGYIVSGGETPLLTTSGQGSPTVTYKQFGTVVNFLPIVLGNGKIHLEVRPEISSINAANGITITTAAGVTSVPGFDTRSAQVAVQMEDGQTLAIGGLIQTSVNATANRIPFLGDLPFVGNAFSSKEYSETEEELVILVTPRLVDPMDCTQLPKYLPGRETRSPDDFELFLEGILELPRGQRNIGHPYKAGHTEGPSSGVYPCGDQSTRMLRGGSYCGPEGCGVNGCNGPACGNGTPAVNSPPRKLPPSAIQSMAPTGRLPEVVDVETAVEPAEGSFAQPQFQEVVPVRGTSAPGNQRYEVRPTPQPAGFGPAVLGGAQVGGRSQGAISAG